MLKISKSQFLRGLQCPKSLWLYKCAPAELRTKPSDVALANMASGTSVGELAQELFPGGELIEFDANDFDGMLNRTEELIESGCKTIYEATFRGDGIFIMVDILHISDSGWELYEVKASTSVKQYHRYDASVQWHALQALGKPLSKAAVVHINNQYERIGDLDIDELFHIEDITDGVIDLQDEIEDQLTFIEEVLEGDEPQIDIGAQCSNPFECDYHAHCWRDVPKRSVFELYWMNGEKKLNLYHSGVQTLDQIPQEMPLSATQKKQVSAYREQRPIINKEIIASFLKTVHGPVSYFDFETFQNAVPRFDKQRPYQQIPFQYSLHIEHGGELEHREFLGDENVDPRRALAEQMLVDIPDEGVIVAYNMGFEKRVIRDLAKDVPDLADQLLLFNERFIDLIVPFRKGGYYDDKMHGSFSIKYVLPAIFPDDPELSYKSLDIQNGGIASDTFANLYRVEDPDEVKRVREALLAYCHLDTLAMVRLMDFLRKVALDEFVI